MLTLSNTQHARRHASCYCVLWNVCSNYCARADNGVCTHPHPRKDRSVGTDVSTIPNHYWFDHKARGDNWEVYGFTGMLRSKHLRSRTPPHVILEDQVTRVKVSMGTDPDMIPNFALAVIPALDHGLCSDEDRVSKFHGFRVLQHQVRSDLDVM